MAGWLSDKDKLDDCNYETWSVQMRSILVCTKKWNIVSGAEQKPTEMRAITQWISEDHMALALIVLNVSTSQLVHITDCKTSYDAWQKLQLIHQPEATVTKVSLYKQLLRFQISENEELPMRIDAFMDIVKKLSDKDVSMGDELLVVILLSKLPKSYEKFVTAMERNENLPSLSQLKVQLIKECANRKIRAAVGVQPTVTPKTQPMVTPKTQPKVTTKAQPKIKIKKKVLIKKK